MAYPGNFVKLTFGGDLYGGPEIWVCGINFAGPITTPWDLIKGDSTFMGAIAGKISVWFASQNAYISNKARLLWVKAAYIGPDGKYADEPLIYDFETPVLGAQNSSSVIFQQSAVLTFETAKLRSPGRFARIYPPLSAPAFGTTGRISANHMTAMATAAQKLINDLNTEFASTTAATVKAVVASQQTNVFNAITRVKVGSLMDIQRSRRNKLQEEYSKPLPIG